VSLPGRRVDGLATAAEVVSADHATSPATAGAVPQGCPPTDAAR
jgi:hypothetical protein